MTQDNLFTEPPSIELKPSLMDPDFRAQLFSVADELEAAVEECNFDSELMLSAAELMRIAARS